MKFLPIIIQVLAVTSALEAAVFTVTVTADSGAGSLRQAIVDAAANPGADEINFAAALEGTPIVLAAEIPVADTDPVSINASSINGGVTIDGGPGSNRIAYIESGSQVTLTGITFTGGDGGGNLFGSLGGAIYNRGTLTMTDCHLSGNSAVSDGGAIYTSGPLTLTRCLLTGNTSGNDGGAIYNSRGTLILEHCCLADNFADQNGGAVHSNTSSINSAITSTSTLRNCTITGNSTRLAGTAIVNDNGMMTLTHCTVTENAILGGNAPAVAGYGDAATTTIVVNSIIAGNASNDVGLIGGSTNTFVSQGNNLIGSGMSSGAFPNTGHDASSLVLAPLGDYGGPTPTMPPLPGSAAIDAGTGSPEPEDQPGFSRPVDGDTTPGAVADIGAAEFQGIPDLATFWNLDFDGDGSPFGIEQAFGTNPLVSDLGNAKNLKAPTFSGGQATVSFGFDTDASPHTTWILKRSTTLSGFTEIFRYDGPTATSSTGPGISAFVGSLGIGSPELVFVITDQNPPPGTAFYRVETPSP